MVEDYYHSQKHLPDFLSKPKKKGFNQITIQKEVFSLLHPNANFVVSYDLQQFLLRV